MINDFYHNTRKDIDEIRARIGNKDSDMEDMEGQHRANIQVYMQKVKRLEYDHRNQCKEVSNDGQIAMADEKNYHVRVVKELRTDKAELKKQLKEEGLSYISDVKNLDDDLERGLKELREQFHNQKEELIAKY